MAPIAEIFERFVEGRPERALRVDLNELESRMQKGDLPPDGIATRKPRKTCGIRDSAFVDLKEVQLSHPQELQAIAVQLHSRKPNPNPCLRCGQDPKRPFIDCSSADNIGEHACGNCIFRHRAIECTQHHSNNVYLEEQESKRRTKLPPPRLGGVKSTRSHYGEAKPFNFVPQELPSRIRGDKKKFYDNLLVKARAGQTSDEETLAADDEEPNEYEQMIRDAERRRESDEDEEEEEDTVASNRSGSSDRRPTAIGDV